MNSDERFMIRVIDLKQWAYCPRILYYHMVLPDIRPLAYKMEAGISAHIKEEGKEKRRSLKSYGLTQGERSFNVHLASADLGLSGELDMFVETETELIPIDFKQSKKAGSHFKLQLAAYGRLLQDTYGLMKPVKRGFLYLIPLRKAVEVKFTPKMHKHLEKQLLEIQQVICTQSTPNPTKICQRCVDCEFRRFCNDVL